MKKYIKYSVLLLLISTIATSCFNDNDDVPRISSTLEIQEYIYRGLNFWSVYKADVPDLANNRFSSDQERIDFLDDFSSPEELFEALKSSRDRFTVLFSDFTVLENSLDGISLNNGMEFSFNAYPNDDTNVFGFVRYVLPGTDAEAKQVKRGMIFNTVDGQQMTRSNFRELTAPDSYTIGLADFDGNVITPNDETIQLTKTQYTENPVFIANTLDVGSSKVGYLMYNAFTSDFDPQLNAAFANFKSEGVTEFVLDLRYNGGGSIESSKDLSSMITGQFTGDVYSREEYNEDRQADFGNIRTFDTEIRGGQAINSLNLSKVYILTSPRTASASELIINSLRPYIQVVQIGTNTTGKFEGSFIVYDAPEPLFRRSEANSGHKYAMLPLVLRSSNVNGVTDYVDGLVPDIELREDLSNAGILGDENEPLLKAALDDILGNRSVGNKNIQNINFIGDSNMFDPTYQRMFVD
ncbi:S41 family peptidase [Aquimarina sp. RZ0]|uniref:S41 family peptidase n=1 Tax=Aquimarina sp. RZ0 TaxID=2607730 RepID=UPI0011F23A85|nr:S41 family peptidase [Aquimarina sp. RZ0]KAA1242794.1 peptidase S41 [Aquimarina sp. RZ0]